MIQIVLKSCAVSESYVGLLSSLNVLLHYVQSRQYNHHLHLCSLLDKCQLTFQRWVNVISTCDQSWNNVDPMLKVKHNPTSELLTLHNVNTKSVSEFEKMLKQLWNNAARNSFNVASTSFQHCLNVKVISKFKLKLYQVQVQVKAISSSG